MIARRLDQFASAQKFQCSLDGALRKAGYVRERAQARRNRLPFNARGLAVEIEVNKIGRRLAIVADDVAHEDVEDIVVDGDHLAKSWHGRIWNPGSHERKSKT